jgi:hypothetical protein
VPASACGVQMECGGVPEGDKFHAPSASCCFLAQLFLSLPRFPTFLAPQWLYSRLDDLGAHAPASPRPAAAAAAESATAAAAADAAEAAALTRIE